VAGKILKFADDRPTKIYHSVYSDEDVSALQSDLCNLVEWPRNGKCFNAYKCKVVLVGFNISKLNMI